MIENPIAKNNNEKNTFTGKLIPSLLSGIDFVGFAMNSSKKDDFLAFLMVHRSNDFLF
jgi:hypothetical protein